MAASYVVDHIESVFDARENKHFVFTSAFGSCHTLRHGCRYTLSPLDCYL